MDMISQFLNQMSQMKFSEPWHKSSDGVFSNTSFEVTEMPQGIVLKNKINSSMHLFAGHSQFRLFSNFLMRAIAGVHPDNTLFKITSEAKQTLFSDARGKTWICQHDESPITLEMIQMFNDYDGIEPAMLFLPKLHMKGAFAPFEIQSSHVFSSFTGALNPIAKNFIPKLNSSVEFKISENQIICSSKNGASVYKFSDRPSALLSKANNVGIFEKTAITVTPEILKLLSSGHRILSEYNPEVLTHEIKPLHEVFNLQSETKVGPGIDITTSHFDENCPVFQIRYVFESLGVTYYMMEGDSPSEILFEVVHPELAGAAILKSLVSKIEALELETEWLSETLLSLKM